ncbi:prolyl aminopeptidase [Nitzschia inconspicua]|uniref:Prolyl aminopeptidase n=1 Tax=Nitzschia inconspicua TaxID=303405 RepID=A0A9K3L8M3_9STRA|nr:prolyl aminopeptidase [Nitzschia inconspicua]
MGARRHLRFITTNPIQSFISCMFLLVLAGRESLISTCGGRAFPTASTVLRRSLFGSTLSKQSKFTDIQHRINSNIVFSNVVLASNSNEDNDTFGSNDLNGNSNDKDNRVPSTGWNHNPPSETSRFWQSPNGDSAAARQSKASSTTGSNGNSNNEPRTGWLHNTKPKEKDNDTAKVGGISKAQQRLKQAMKAQEENHRIVHPPSFHACGNDRQIVVTEHRISVPVFQDSKQPRIDVAFSIVEEVKDDATRQFYESMQSMTPSQRAAAYVETAALKTADDMMIYLQGGPGFGSPVPVTGLAFSQGSSWGAAALGKYKRIVLMDQRGTGQSTPITKQSLQVRFPDLFSLDDKEGDLDQLAKSHPEEYNRMQQTLIAATDYMAQFRADNIVKDAELIREALLQPLPADSIPVPRPWGCSLGQSFGGFCTMTYLSLIENPPKVALFTGGIAPMTFSAYDVYNSLWAKVKERNLQYYSMYPGDISIVKKIVKTLLQEPATLPSGGKLTARRFLQLGMSLGGSPSSFASMHNLVSTAFLQPDEVELTRGFLKTVDNIQPFDEHPIYYWLHEAIYCDGPKFSPSDWSAHRAYEAQIQTPSELDYRLTSQLPSDARPTFFFGEMVFPWMSEDYAECSGLGCTALANALAGKEDWGPLYDVDRIKAVLAAGTSKSAAAVYYDDIYVDFDCCMKLTARGGPMEKVKVYITNDYQHSGLRDDGANIFTKLHGMATGSVRTPS